MIIVPQKWTPQQLKRAEAKANEYRVTRYTSGVANLDNMIALNKAVILCPDHTRKFSPKQARYRAHPDKQLRRVIGNCDVCQVVGLSFLFLNEKDALDEQRKLEKFRAVVEYQAHGN